MNVSRTIARLLAVLSPILLVVMVAAAQSSFHNAPASANQMKNPLAGQAQAVRAGETLFTSKCGVCHGKKAEGMGNVPSLAKGPTQSAAAGELFWYITKGDLNNGMPSWETLPEQSRWQIITFLKTLGSGSPEPAASPAPAASSAEAPSSPSGEAPSASTSNVPPPPHPFTDYRFEKPGLKRKITLADLPAPYVTPSAGNGPEVVPRPKDAWPQVPSGFTVKEYATGLTEPRLIRTAPNGDFFVAESEAGNIKVFRGINSEGKAEQVSVFASGLNKPFGINFYPAGPKPEWVYVGNTDSVVRFPYQNGDLKARGKPEHLADLPGEGGHWTRDIQFSRDGKKMLVSVGSVSNVDDPDTTPAEKNRADVLEFNPDGSGMKVYAYGIRNCVGLAVSPKTGEAWCSVNERDGLGDNLVPDYITHVQPGGFYGWPWWYMGGHQDPRHEGKRPELKDKVITPDVILQPHNASLGLTFYDGKQFPAEYHGDIFAAEHGSWNKATRAGYELIRVPLDDSGHATGEYQDFMTGFVVDPGHVWGRPVGVTVAPDGSLLVSDDASNTIWRITYSGEKAAGAN